MMTLYYMYLKLNLLIALGYIAWLLVTWATDSRNGSVTFNARLRLARTLLVLVLLLGMLVPLLLVVIPGPVSRLQHSVIGESWPGLEVVNFAGELLVTPVMPTARIDGISEVVETLLLAAVLIQFLLVGTRLVRLHRIINGASQWRSIGQLQVLFSESVSIPFSTCVFGRLQIVLPWCLVEDTENLKIALRHELQHYRNGDLHWLVLLELLRTVMAWNPFVHFWLQTLEELQEFACDEALLRNGRVEHASYRNCLVKTATMESRPPDLPACAGMAGNRFLFRNESNGVMRRMEMMKQYKQAERSKWAVWLQGAVLSGVFGAGSLLVYAQQTTEPQTGSDYRARIDRVKALTDAGDSDSALLILDAMKTDMDAGRLNAMDTFAWRAALMGVHRDRKEFARAAEVAGEILVEHASQITEAQYPVWVAVRDNLLRQAAREPLTPLEIKQPEYPAQALEQKIEGWTQVRFSVDAQGHVYNPVMVGHCISEESGDICAISSSAMFYQSSMAAISDFVFTPKLENGLPVAAEDIQYVFRYNLPEGRN